MINLAEALKQRSAPTKEVFFARITDPRLGTDEVVVVDDPKEAVGSFVVEYQDAAALRKLGEAATIRAVKKANKAVKGLLHDQDQLYINVSLAAVKSWKLTGKSLQALKFPASVPAADDLPFSEENVKILADRKNGVFGEFVLQILNNYDFFFGVTAEEEEGNFGTGRK